ncbi:MAG: PrgI family protein [Candidatus Taylorbacteria bacterium]
MRFQVPQFIDVEDRIFGPLTLKQFIYIAGGGGISFMLYVFINNLFFSLIPIILVMSLSVALGFYKINKKPLIDMIEYGFKYYLGNKLYIWKKEDKPQPQTIETAVRDAKNYASITVPKISDSKLKDLTWSLDIKESMYSNRNQR